MDLREKAIQEIHLETKLKKILIEEIADSQFEFIKHIAMPKMKNVRLMYFGVFGIKPNRMKYFKVNKLEDNDKE